MAILNSFRLFVLASIGAIAFLYLRDSGTAVRPKRDLEAWFKFPYTCTNTQDRYIALTFDEGPAAKTGEVLDALRRWEVKATFHFQTGYLQNPDNIKLIQRAYNEGHLVGLRWDPRLPLPTAMSITAFRDSLLKQSNDLAYWMGAKKYPKYLRMPWNETNTQINQVLTDYGFIATSWNQDPMDYALNAASDPKFVGEIVRTNATSMRSQIVLLHDIYPAIATWINPTLDIIQNISKTTIATDTKIVTMDQCLGDAPYRSSNAPISSTGTGTSQQASDPANPADYTTKPSSETTAASGPKSPAGRIAVVGYYLLSAVALCFVLLA